MKIKDFQLYLVYALFLLTVCDLGLTNYSLSMGYAVEANPVMGFYASKGPVTFAVAKLFFNSICCFMLYFGAGKLEGQKAKILIITIFALTLAHVFLVFYHFYGILFLT